MALADIEGYHNSCWGHHEYIRAVQYMGDISFFYISGLPWVY